MFSFNIAWNFIICVIDNLHVFWATLNFDFEYWITCGDYIPWQTYNSFFKLTCDLLPWVLVASYDAITSVKDHFSFQKLFQSFNCIHFNYNFLILLNCFINPCITYLPICSWKQRTEALKTGLSIHLSFKLIYWSREQQ